MLARHVLSQSTLTCKIKATDRAWYLLNFQGSDQLSAVLCSISDEIGSPGGLPTHQGPSHDIIHRRIGGSTIESIKQALIGLFQHASREGDLQQIMYLSISGMGNVPRHAGQAS